jgi:hypothetical protein
MSGQDMPFLLRQALQDFQAAAIGVPRPECLEWYRYVARWCEWAANGGEPTADEFSGMIGAFHRIPDEILMPDLGWDAVADFARQLPELEFRAYLAGPPAPDWQALDESGVEVENSSSFAVSGQRRPRGATA